MKFTTEQIIASYPVNDDGVWRMFHIWAYPDGTYSECDADGNHENISSDDAAKAVVKEASSWIEYLRFCVTNGIDPLGGVYGVSRKIKRSARVVLHMKDGVGGRLYLTRLTRSGRRVSISKSPEALLKWCEIKQLPNGASVSLFWKSSAQALRELQSIDDVKTKKTPNGIIISARAVWEEERSERSISSQIRNLARLIIQSKLSRIG